MEDNVLFDSMMDLLTESAKAIVNSDMGFFSHPEIANVVVQTAAANDLTEDAKGVIDLKPYAPFDLTDNEKYFQIDLNGHSQGVVGQLDNDIMYYPNFKEAEVLATVEQIQQQEEQIVDIQRILAGYSKEEGDKIKEELKKELTDASKKLPHFTKDDIRLLREHFSPLEFSRIMNERQDHVTKALALDTMDKTGEGSQRAVSDAAKQVVEAAKEKQNVVVGMIKQIAGDVKDLMLTPCRAAAKGIRAVVIAGEIQKQIEMSKEALVADIKAKNVEKDDLKEVVNAKRHEFKKATRRESFAQHRVDKLEKAVNLICLEAREGKKLSPAMSIKVAFSVLAKREIPREKIMEREGKKGTISKSQLKAYNRLEEKLAKAKEELGKRTEKTMAASKEWKQARNNYEKKKDEIEQDKQAIKDNRSVKRDVIKEMRNEKSLENKMEDAQKRAEVLAKERIATPDKTKEQNKQKDANERTR